MEYKIITTSKYKGETLKGDEVFEIKTLMVKPEYREETEIYKSNILEINYHYAVYGYEIINNRKIRTIKLFTNNSEADIKALSLITEVIDASKYVSNKDDGEVPFLDCKKEHFKLYPKLSLEDIVDCVFEEESY